MLIQGYRDRVLPFSAPEEILPMAACDYKDFTVSSQSLNPIISKYSIEDGVMYLDQDTQFLKITLPPDTKMVHLFVLNIETVTIAGPWNVRPSCDVGMGLVLYRQCLFSDQIEQVHYEYMRGQSASVTFNEAFAPNTNVLLAVRTSSCCTTTYNVKLRMCSSQKTGVKSEPLSKPPSELFFIGDKLYKTNSSILSSTRDQHCKRQDVDMRTKVHFQTTAPPITFLGDDKTCQMARAISRNRQIYFDLPEGGSSPPGANTSRPDETGVARRQTGGLDTSTPLSTVHEIDE